MIHNAEVKLCNLHQFAEAFNGIESCKIFYPSFMFHHSTKNCIWLLLICTNSNKFWYWSNSLVSSVETFAINRLLKYLHYRQTQACSGNAENIQFRFGSPRRDPFFTLRHTLVWISTYTLVATGLDQLTNRCVATHFSVNCSDTFFLNLVQSSVDIVASFLQLSHLFHTLCSSL